MTGVLAHQGGWDEAFLVAVPMLVVAWLLWLAKRRVNRTERAADEVTNDPPVDQPDLHSAP